MVDLIKVNEMGTTGRKNNSYSDDFKIKVVQEAILGEISKSAICRKYSIPRTATIWDWINIFAPEYKSKTIPMAKSKESENAEIRELKKLLQQKEAELSKERMRADFYNTMIDVAEDMFNIPIRKKAGTKQ